MYVLSSILQDGSFDLDKPLTQQVSDYVDAAREEQDYLYQYGQDLPSTQQFPCQSQGFVPFQASDVSTDSTLGLVDNVLQDMKKKKGFPRMSQRVARLSLKRMIRPRKVSEELPVVCHNCDIYLTPFIF